MTFQLSIRRTPSQPAREGRERTTGHVKKEVNPAGFEYSPFGVMSASSSSSDETTATNIPVAHEKWLPAIRPQSARHSDEGDIHRRRFFCRQRQVVPSSQTSRSTNNCRLEPKFSAR